MQLQTGVRHRCGQIAGGQQRQQPEPGLAGQKNVARLTVVTEAMEAPMIQGTVVPPWWSKARVQGWSFMAFSCLQRGLHVFIVCRRPRRECALG